MQSIKDILADRQKATEWLYQTFGRKLVGYAISVYQVNEDAGWDLVYKTIYRVIDTSGNYNFESEQKLGSFLFKVFINYLKNHIRDEKTKHNNTVFVPLDETRRDFAAKNDVPAQNPRLAILNEELAKLEDWQRILLLMRSQDMSYAEIAAYVKKPEDQLKVYYQRLKNKLSEAVQKRVNEFEAEAAKSSEKIATAVNSNLSKQ